MKALFQFTFVLFALMFTAFAAQAGVESPVFWENITKHIPEASPMLIASVAFVYDMVCRLLKTNKPAGVLQTIAGGLKIALSVANGIVLVIQKLADLYDKVNPVPQRLK